VIARRTFFGIVIAAAWPAANLTYGQGQKPLPRLGWLHTRGEVFGTPLEQGFLEGMRELGYVEGRDYVIERRHAEGRVERLPAIAAELVALKVDVIFAPGPPESRAAQQATKTIPIVFSQLGDPVASGAVASLARPGGNMTGLSTVNVELIAKRLSLLKELRAKATRIAVLYDPNVLENIQNLEALRDPAKQLGISLIPVQAQRVEDLEPAFEAIKKSQADAALVIANPFFLMHRKQLNELAVKARVPTMHVRPEFVDDGGLMSYAPDPVDQARRAAGYVVKIFKGANPGNLPIQQPIKFELLVNMRTAKALGVNVPDSVKLRADKVIE
jgi:putative tryptophan/tyrosine transport system substrate-binding protein